jgi:hypothetical protein
MNLPSFVLTYEETRDSTLIERRSLHVGQALILASFTGATLLSLQRVIWDAQ